jgi:hypothetical protein
MPCLTLISSQFIHLRHRPPASARRCALPAPQELPTAAAVAAGAVAAGTKYYELADTIDVGLVRLHGGSSDSNGGGSSLTWLEEKGQLIGRQDRMMVVKKCRAFKAETPRQK